MVLPDSCPRVKAVGQTAPGLGTKEGTRKDLPYLRQECPTSKKIAGRKLSLLQLA